MSLLAVFSSAARDSVRADFRQLFEEHHGLVIGYFRRKQVDLSLAEDLSQETFFRAYRALDDFRGDAQPRTWLMHIAGNVWRNHLRDRFTQKRSAEEVSLAEDHRQIASSEKPAVDEAILLEKRRAVAEAIRQLPAGMQRCVWLRVYEDMSFKEIAEVSGVSVGSAKSQVSLSRAKLEGILGQTYPELLDALSEPRTAQTGPAVDMTKKA